MPYTPPIFGPWQDNTLSNPFFRSRHRVEVQTHDGQTLTFACASCAAPQFTRVKRWRTVTFNPPGTPGHKPKP